MAPLTRFENRAHRSAWSLPMVSSYKKVHFRGVDTYRFRSAIESASLHQITPLPTDGMRHFRRVFIESYGALISICFQFSVLVKTISLSPSDRSICVEPRDHCCSYDSRSAQLTPEFDTCWWTTVMVTRDAIGGPCGEGLDWFQKERKTAPTPTEHTVSQRETRTTVLACPEVTSSALCVWLNVPSW